MPEALTYLAKLNTWKRNLERQFRPLDLTTTQAHILVALADGPLQNGQLSRATGITFGDVSVVANRLESAGFVNRTHGTDDRRKVRFSLTEKGAAMVPQIRSALEQFGNQAA